MSLDAMKQALEALVSSRVFVTTREKIKHPEGTEWYDERIAALRLAIEQAERQEPVAWIGLTDEEFSDCLVEGDPCEALAEPEAWTVMREVEAKLREKNAAPPQRQPLTVKEVYDLIEDCTGDGGHVHYYTLVRSVERKHGIGGGE
jgi:hypothetical protein